MAGENNRPGLGMLTRVGVVVLQDMGQKIVVIFLHVKMEIGDQDVCMAVSFAEPEYRLVTAARRQVEAERPVDGVDDKVHVRHGKLALEVQQHAHVDKH